MTVPAAPASADGASPSRRAPSGASTVAALVGWVVLVAVAGVYAEPYRATWKLRAAPLAGFFDRHVTPVTFVVLALGLALARFVPGWCARLGWRRLLLATALLSVVWGGALASTRGFDGLHRGMAHRHEYPAVIPAVDRLGVDSFVRTFSDESVLRTYPIHVQGHPVGAPLLFVALDRIGLGGSGAAAAVVVAAWATTAPAVLLTVRSVAGATRARRCAPFLVLAPGTVWAVTSADGLFAAVAAWGTAAMVVASEEGASPRRRVLLGLAGGVIWGLGIHLSYGLVPVGIIATVLVARRRAWSVVGWTAIGAGMVVTAFVGAGFWWLAGLDATHARYRAGIASVRPRWFFTFIGNPAALALAAGPAFAVALVRVRDRSLWWIAGLGLAALGIANASGLSKAEVERIWLPFLPWVLVLTAGLPALGRVRPRGSGQGRSWVPPSWPLLAGVLLALQVVVAVAVETFVKTPW